MDEDKYQDLKMLALKERKPVKALLTDFVEDYLKKHKDGNPQYLIDQFQDPNFMACPAFYRPITVWETYFKQASEKEKENIKNQMISIDKKLGMYL